jgi:hypothetical protein
MNLPHGIQKQIDKAQTGISQRAVLESNIAYNTALKTNNLYNHIRLFLMDTISQNPMDSIEKILNTEGLTDAWRKFLFDGYTGANDTLKANTLRQATLATGTCQHFGDIAEIQIGLMDAVSVSDSINTDGQMQSSLNTIAACTDACCNIKAQCMLAMANESSSIPLIEDITPGNTAIGMYNENGTMDSEEKPSIMNIYPNPGEASRSVNVELVSENETLENSNIEVYNLSGQVVYQGTFEGSANRITLDTATLHPGIYFVKLSQQGNILEVKKLLVNP